MEDRENAEEKILRFVIAARERENSIKSDIFAKIYARRNLRGLPRILMLLMFFFSILFFFCSHFLLLLGALWRHAKDCFPTFSHFKQQTLSDDIFLPIIVISPSAPHLLLRRARFSCYCICCQSGKQHSRRWWHSLTFQLFPPHRYDHLTRPLFRLTCTSVVSRQSKSQKSAYTAAAETQQQLSNKFFYVESRLAWSEAEAKRIHSQQA